MENRPIIIFDVLTRNEKKNEQVYSYIYRKDCRLGNVLSPIRTGENQVEVCIQVTENINTQKLLDSIKVGLEKVRQLDGVKRRKIMKENDEIIIKIQKV